MRAIVTGQVGMDKRRYLDSAVQFAGEQGETINLYNVGDMMYGEAPDVRSGRILDLPLSGSTPFGGQRSRTSSPSHATRRTCSSTPTRPSAGARPLPAFDFDQIRLLNPTSCICLVDNIEMVHHRLHTEHEIDATLKDCMVWREEEILATELPPGPRAQHPVLHCRPGTQNDDPRRHVPSRLPARHAPVYPSFPMTHVVGMPDVLAEIDAFRAELGTSSPSTPAMSTRNSCSTTRVEAAKGQDFIDAPSWFGGSARSRDRSASVSARSSTSRATSTARSTCATSSSSTSPT
jgi:adenylate kinase